MRREKLRINNLTFRAGLDGSLDNVSLCLLEGQITGLIGMHFSGKDLLVHLLTSEVKGRYDFWNVWIGGQKITGDSIPRGMVYVMQTANYRMGDWTVSDYIALHSSPWIQTAGRKGMQEKKVQEKIDSFGIPLRASSLIRDLTEYELRLMDIVNACVMGCEILIIDDDLENFYDSDLQALHAVLHRMIENRMGVIVNSTSAIVSVRLSDQYIFFKLGCITKKCSKEYFRALEEGSDNVFGLEEIRQEFGVGPNDLKADPKAVKQKENVNDSWKAYEGRWNSEEDEEDMASMPGRGLIDLNRIVFGLDERRKIGQMSTHAASKTTVEMVYSVTLGAVSEDRVYSGGIHTDDFGNIGSWTAGEHGQLKDYLSFCKGEVTCFISANQRRKESLFALLSGRAYPDRTIYRVGDWSCRKPHMHQLISKRVISVDDLGSGRGLFLNLSARENLLLPSLSKISSLDYIFHSAALGEQVLSHADLEMLSDQTLIHGAQGNDLLKVMLERWYIFHPVVLVVLEPFARCDVYGVPLVQSYLARFAEAGTAVIAIKSRSEYMTELSDRLINF